jgi:hypothetical protein
MAGRRKSAVIPAVPVDQAAVAAVADGISSLPPAGIGDNSDKMGLAEMVAAAITELALVLARSATPLSVKVPEGPLTEEQAQALITCSKQATLVTNDIDAKRKAVTKVFTDATAKVAATAKRTADDLAAAKAAANKALLEYMTKAGIDQLRNEHGHLATRRAAKLVLEITNPGLIPLEMMAPDEAAITAKIEEVTQAAIEAAGDDPDEVNRSVAHARENAVPGARLVFGERSLVVS